MKKIRNDKKISRVRTNITLSREMYNLAVDYDLNLSAFLENKLVEYFLQRKQLSGMYCISSNAQPYASNTQNKQHRQSQNVTNKTSKSFTQQSECGYRDSNPGDWLGKPIS